MLEETNKEHQRKIDSLKKDFIKKESDLREKLRQFESTLRNEAEPKIHHLEKEISELLSDLHTQSADIETLKTENSCLKQRIEESERSSEEIIDIKDTQIKQLQECNRRLSLAVEEYELKSDSSIQQLKQEHNKLQSDFDQAYSQLTLQCQSESFKLQECCEELEKVTI